MPSKANALTLECLTGQGPLMRLWCRPGTVGDPQGLQSPGSTDPAAEVADGERAQGSMTRTRTNSEKQGEVPKSEGPYPARCEVPRAGTQRATDSGTVKTLRTYALCAREYRTGVLGIVLCVDFFPFHPYSVSVKLSHEQPSTLSLPEVQ